MLEKKEPKKSMKRIISFYQNLKIRNKIILCFFLVIIVSFLTIGVLYSVSFQNAMTELANDSTGVIIDQANREVEKQIIDIERLMDILSYDAHVKMFTNQSESKTPDDLYLTRLNICNKLDKYKSTYPEITGIAIVARDGSYISNEMFKPQKSNLSREDWYTACVTTKDKYVLTVNPVSRNLTYYETISADEILSISKAILDENGAAVGVMIVDINLASIEHILDKVTIGKKGFVVIMDDSENFIYAPVNSVSPRIRSAWFNNDEGTFEKIILDDKYQFISQIASASWTPAR